MEADNIACGTCKYWRMDPRDGVKKCWYDVAKCGALEPIEIDPWDQVLECADWTER